MRPMQTTEHGWKIIDADAGVLSFTYEFNPGATSNCFTARLASGGLLVLSPPTKISREAAEDLAPYGKVEALVANNGYHHLGIARWRELFPEARCFAAPGAKTRIDKRSRDAGELEPLDALTPLLAEGVAVVETPSSKCGETWARAKIEDGHAWYASDILANMQELPPSFVFGLLFKWTKSAPGYRPFNLAHKIVLKDRKAVMRAMLEDVRKHPPRVMVPAHGGILSSSSLAAETEQLLVDATR
jgi:hypothetical protein